MLLISMELREHQITIRVKILGSTGAIHKIQTQSQEQLFQPV